LFLVITGNAPAPSWKIKRNADGRITEVRPAVKEATALPRGSDFNAVNCIADNCGAQKPSAAYASRASDGCILPAIALC
jgi:hypothetical protein